MVRGEAFIAYTGSYLPEKVLSNSCLESMVDTSDEWIVSRTGIKNRRIADKSEATSDLGVFAAKDLLEKAKMAPTDIDMIIVATLSPDYPFPSTACMIQKKLGAKCPSFDVMAACSGMLFALATAKGFILSGQHKRILIVAAEKVSSVLDYTDRSTCVLFGDGASAALVTDEPISENALAIGEIDLGSDGEMHKALEIPAGGCFDPISKEVVEERRHYLRMDGQVVFKHAVRRMNSSIGGCLAKAGLTSGDIDYFIPHQANHRIMESLLKRLEIDPSKVHNNVENVGNTCSASIGICLDEYFDKRANTDKTVLMCTFGAGFTWGSMILRGAK